MHDVRLSLRHQDTEMNHAPEIQRPVIRKAGHADRDGIWNIFFSSVLTLLGTHYEQEEVLSFANSVEPESFDASIPTAATLVAEDDGKIVAFGQFDAASNEVISLYAAPGYAGRGIGRELLGLFDEMAKENGSGWIQAGSTLNAVGFFEKQGYKQARMEALQLPDGSTLPRIRMSRSFPEKG